MIRNRQIRVVVRVRVIVIAIAIVVGGNNIIVYLKIHILL